MASSIKGASAVHSEEEEEQQQQRGTRENREKMKQEREWRIEHKS